MRNRTLIASSLCVAMTLMSWIALCQPSLAEGRVALVIGNGTYRKVPILPNPIADATDVAASLGRLGFAVTQIKDANFDDLRRALIDFGGKARQADMAMIYFAGHGMEVAGENWIVPVDAELLSDADTENEAIGLRSLMLAVSGARTIGMVILDACRNNPFDMTMKRSGRSRSVGRGLAPIEPSDNVLVAFAAKDGTTAADGDGRHSPFTAALLQHIESPGLEINFLFRNVRDDVLTATNRQQQPFVYGSLSKAAVYLKAPEPSPVAVESANAPDASEIAWPFLRETTDATSLRRFVTQFPGSPHGSEAREMVASLDAAALASATTPSTAGAKAVAPAPALAPDAAGIGLAKPEQAAVARRFQDNSPAVEAAWSLIKTSADSVVLRRFVDEFPDERRKIVVKALGGAPGSGPVLKQLRDEQMRAVLSEYGTFTTHPRYGEVWRPTVTPMGWHPYEPCHWINTRRLGWYYFDQTPWGAIVHHYGRWTHEASLGWVWVPGTDFSPGWVVWRTNAQKVGWVPTPPADDLDSPSAEPLDHSALWTFMDAGTFAKGCGAAAVAPPPVVKTLIRETTYVHDLRIVAGIAIIVLPPSVEGDLVDFDIAFDPWPALSASKIVSDWNGLWNASVGAMVCPLSTPVPGPVLIKAIKPSPSSNQPLATKPQPKAVRVVPLKVVFTPPARPAAPTRPRPIVRPIDPVDDGPPPGFYEPPPRFHPSRPPLYGQEPPARYRPSRPPLYGQEPPPRYDPPRPPIYDQRPPRFQDHPYGGRDVPRYPSSNTRYPAGSRSEGFSTRPRFYQDGGFGSFGGTANGFGVRR